MNQSNSVTNWQNGCREQEIGGYVGEHQEMVGLPVHSTQNAMGKKPTLTIIQVAKDNKKYVFGGYNTNSWEIDSKFEIIVVYYFYQVFLMLDLIVPSILLFIGFVICNRRL